MSRRFFHRDERGAAAAEFALILPLMLVLAFSIYEAGRVFWTYTIVSASARDAARYGARLAITCTSTGAGSFDDTTAPTEIANLTRTGTLDGTGTPLVPNWTDNSTVTVSVTPCVSNTGGAMKGRYDGHSYIPTVSVTAAAPYGVLFGGLLGDLSIDTVSVSNNQAWTE